MSFFYEKHAEDDPVKIFEIGNFDFPSHLHKEVEIVQVIRGTCTMTIEQETHQFTAGSAAVIFPHCIHSYHFSHDYTANLYIVNAQLIPDYEQLMANFLPETPIIIANHELETCLSRSHQTPTDFRDLYFRRALWNMIFALIIQQMTFVKRDSGGLTLTHKILTYINNHYLEPLSLQELASTLDCNTFTISKIFSNKVGISFPLYLAHLRIAFAKQLLETTEDSIIEIAFAAGFDNQRSFNRSFLKIAGLTPREYRNERLALNL